MLEGVALANDLSTLCNLATAYLYTPNRDNGAALVQGISKTKLRKMDCRLVVFEAFKNLTTE